MIKESEIRKYAWLMREFDLTALEVTESGVRLEREKKESQLVAASAAQVRPAAEAAPALGGDDADISSATDMFVVRSPMVGVFYAAPAENAEPYVSLGDRVQKGQTLCIIEAMKLMNEIAADESGTVAEICVTNGQVVEYGTELFRLKLR